LVLVFPIFAAATAARKRAAAASAYAFNEIIRRVPVTRNYRSQAAGDENNGCHRLKPNKKPPGGGSKWEAGVLFRALE
jgi:hypothetical protein